VLELEDMVVRLVRPPKLADVHGDRWTARLGISVARIPRKRVELAVVPSDIKVLGGDRKAQAKGIRCTSGVHSRRTRVPRLAAAYRGPFALACRPLSRYLCKWNAQQPHHRAKIRRRLS